MPPMLSNFQPRSKPVRSSFESSNIESFVIHRVCPAVSRKPWCRVAVACSPSVAIAIARTIAQ
eukprot:14632712-Alexandrium_andersonii.AAC.1